jgi:hypothetical protein
VLLAVLVVLVALGFPAATLKFLLLLGFLLLLVVLGFLLVVTSGEGGSRLTPSGIGVTHLGTARRARRRCRWLTAAMG